jgi:alkylation response protein AidB-like acyl-CoA dehydrogenase
VVEETAAFRADRRRYLEEEIEPPVDVADRSGPMDREELVGYLRDLREPGVGFDLETAPQYFGDRPRFAVASAEMSRVWPSLNVAIQMSFPALFVQHAAESTQDAEFDKLQRGECIACLAVSVPDGGSDIARPRTKAHRDGDEYVIEGSKTGVGNGGIADVALVVAEDTEIGAADTSLVSREQPVGVRTARQARLERGLQGPDGVRRGARARRELTDERRRERDGRRPRVDRGPPVPRERHGAVRPDRRRGAAGGFGGRPPARLGRQGVLLRARGGRGGLGATGCRSSTARG